MNFEVTSIDSSAQDERNVIISKFINGSSKILITSDLLGRCRNYSELQLVINYDLPVSNDLYCIRVDNRSRCSRKSKEFILIDMYRSCGKLCHT